MKAFIVFAFFLTFIILYQAIVSSNDNETKINITLNVSKVWWEDDIQASGTLYNSSGGIPNENVNVTLDGVIKCSVTTDSNGNYDCDFTAPNELGDYKVNATSENASVSTVLQVRPSYGELPIGTIDRVVYEQPYLMQDKSGKIRIVQVKVTLYKG
jgi:hypothetical protein